MSEIWIRWILTFSEHSQKNAGKRNWRITKSRKSGSNSEILIMRMAADRTVFDYAHSCWPDSLWLCAPFLSQDFSDYQEGCFFKNLEIFCLNHFFHWLVLSGNWPAEPVRAVNELLTGFHSDNKGIRSECHSHPDSPDYGNKQAPIERCSEFLLMLVGIKWNKTEW